MNNQDRAPSIPPSLVIFFGILAVSTASIFIRFAQQEANSLVIAAYRLTIATTVISPIAIRNNRQELLSLNRRDVILALLSGGFLALHFVSWITSLEFTTVASSVTLVSTTPLWVALLAPITLREPLTRHTLLGMMIALLGGIIVGMSDACTISAVGVGCPAINQILGREAAWGDALALIGALTAAGYLLIGRSLRERMSLIPYIFLVYGVAGLFLMVLIVSTGQPLLGYSPTTYLWFLLLGLVPQLLGHSAFNWSLRYLPAAFVSITLLGEPIGSTVLAYFLLSESPTALKLIGAILILAGIVLASRPTQKKK